MEIISKADFLKKKKFYIRRLKESIFIYPTDTIYGIGCNAMNKELVQKIRFAKKRLGNPFSVIVPGKEWIENNCEIDDKVEGWLSKLPGNYTLVMNLSNRKAVAPNVNLDGKTLGIRMPDHWFQAIVKEMEVPIVTTSVNVQGLDFMTKSEDLDPAISKIVEYMIDDGVIEGKPSILVMLDDNNNEVIER